VPNGNGASKIINVRARLVTNFHPYARAVEIVASKTGSKSFQGTLDTRCVSAPRNPMRAVLPPAAPALRTTTLPMRRQRV
jgi:hypothetical protein